MLHIHGFLRDRVLAVDAALARTCGIEGTIDDISTRYEVSFENTMLLNYGTIMALLYQWVSCTPTDLILSCMTVEALKQAFMRVAAPELALDSAVVAGKTAALQPVENPLVLDESAIDFILQISCVLDSALELNESIQTTVNKALLLRLDIALDSAVQLMRSVKPVTTSSATELLEAIRTTTAEAIAPQENTLELSSAMHVRLSRYRLLYEIDDLRLSAFDHWTLAELDRIILSE